jgi:hypothetical protein
MNADYDDNGRNPRSNDSKTSGGTGAKITLGFLLLLDLVVIGLMIYSTTAKFAMVGRWTVKLNKEFRIKGKNVSSCSTRARDCGVADGCLRPQARCVSQPSCSR